MISQDECVSECQTLENDNALTKSPMIRNYIIIYFDRGSDANRLLP